MAPHRTELKDSVFCWSGGVESTVMMMQAVEEADGLPVEALHVNYGQRSYRGERRAIRYMQQDGEYFGIRLRSVKAPYIGRAQESAILKNNKGKTNELPGRNFYLATIATRFSDVIYFGFPDSRVDAQAFWDCTHQWCKECSRVLSKMLDRTIIVSSWFQNVSRKDIFTYGLLTDPDLMRHVYTCMLGNQSVDCPCDHCKDFYRMMKECGL